MARQRVIVGMGEALLAEQGDSARPAGLAALVALNAARLGHAGVAVSRLGQDRAGDELLAQLRARSVDISHLQSDPDLPTGRWIVRGGGSGNGRLVGGRAAFDNLQWDFDLNDIAQQADAVVFGQLARRDGQSRSIIKRFLAECGAAMRIFDLTNRTGDAVSRAEVLSGLEFAEGLIVDDEGLRLLCPQVDDKAEGWKAEASGDVLGASRLEFIAAVSPTDAGLAELSMNVHTRKGSSRGARGYPREAHEAAVIGMVHGVLSGCEHAQNLELASRIAAHAAENPEGEIPAELLK